MQILLPYVIIIHYYNSLNNFNETDIINISKYNVEHFLLNIQFFHRRS